MEGKGTLYDKETGNFYCGNFHNQQKEGFGMIWFGMNSTLAHIFDQGSDVDLSCVEDEPFDE